MPSPLVSKDLAEGSGMSILMAAHARAGTHIQTGEEVGIKLVSLLHSHAVGLCPSCCRHHWRSFVPCRSQ